MNVFFLFNTTVFPVIQVKNSDILQFSQHFKVAYYLPGFDTDTETTFISYDSAISSGFKSLVFYSALSGSTACHSGLITFVHPLPLKPPDQLPLLCLHCVALLTLPKARFFDKFSSLVPCLLHKSIKRPGHLGEKRNV